MIWTRGLPEGDTLVDALTGTVKIDVELVHVLDEWLTALADDAVPAHATSAGSYSPAIRWASSSRAEARSRPNGFSTTSRERPARPAAAIPSATARNSDGGTAK